MNCKEKLDYPDRLYCNTIMCQLYKIDESGLFKWEIFNVNLALVLVKGGKLLLDETSMVEVLVLSTGSLQFSSRTVDNVCEVS